LLKTFVFSEVLKQSTWFDERYSPPEGQRHQRQAGRHRRHHDWDEPLARTALDRLPEVRDPFLPCQC
jgi:hypothetical protein